MVDCYCVECWGLIPCFIITGDDLHLDHAYDDLGCGSDVGHGVYKSDFAKHAYILDDFTFDIP